MQIEEPIDAVITWVDSSDLIWQKKINQFSKKKIDWNNKKSSSNYYSLNEVEIVILSILKYAKFIKNIYLVTDNQKPNNFKSLKMKAQINQVNLELVDHLSIFRDHKEYLPCFSSCSIITMLYKIPKLSENFVIFNDDTFLMRETKPSDFFKNQKVVIRGKWDSFYEDKNIRKLYVKIKAIFKGVQTNKIGYKLAQQKSAKLLGFKKYVRRDHTPVSIKKSTLETYFKENPNFLDNNIKHRFRDNSQFIISSLSNHLEIINDNYELETNFQLTYFQSYKYFKTKFKLFCFDYKKDKKFMCFQALELAPKKTLKLIFNWIDKKLDTNFSETN